MSGHSKWSTIKRKKEAKDVARGKVFSKLSRAITLAVRQGGGNDDPDKNVKLRLAIDRAKQFNMPKENIKRAINKATSSSEAGLKEIIYEGYGPVAIALIIEVATDNPNRTCAEVRSVLERHGGKIGAANSVVYLFDQCGMVVFDKKKTSEDQVFQFADKMKAKDIEEEEDSFIVYIPFESLGHVKEHLNSLSADSIEAYFRPLSTVKIQDKDKAKKILNLVEELEELEDVQKVYANFDIPDQFLR